MQARVRFDHQLLAVETEHHVHCLLELTAPPAPKGPKRLPLHLSLVLDRSGSMSGRKLEVAKECAGWLARRLKPDDRLALVVFDDTVDLVAGLQLAGQQLHRAIASVFPGGSTNLSGGWLKGQEQLRAVSGGQGPRKILLLTDGLANVGITHPEELVALAKRASDEGIGTTTIGFGEGFDEDLLTRMADAGGGNAHYAETPDEAPAIFAQEFAGLATLVAQNVSVEIRPGEKVEMVGVLNEYPQTRVPGGVQIALGDAYGEERRRVVFELRIPRLAELGVAKFAEVVVRYVSVGAEIAAHELTMPITANLVSADEAAKAEADAEVTEEVAVLKAARAQEEARIRAYEGDLEGAQKLLRSAAEDLRRIAPGSAKAEELLAQAEEADSYGAMMAQGPLDLSAMKKMRYSSRQRQRGRPRKD